MPRSKLSVKSMELILDLLAMLAIFCVCLPYAALPVAYYPHTNVWGRCLAIFLCFVLGWGLQHAICLVTRHRRTVQRGGYEKSQKYYHIGLALPVWGLAVAAFLVMPSIVDGHLQYIAQIDPNYYYDRYSVFPMTVSLIAAALLVLGSATRLYPYSRAVSLRACMTYVALFLISFFIGGGNISAISLLVFAICAALLLNQSTLDRERMSLSLGDLPLAIRIGGMRTVLWLGAVFLGVCGVMTVIVGGGMMVGRVLLFMLLRQRENVQSDSFGEYGTNEEVLGRLDRYLVREGEMGGVNMLLMVLFIIGVILLVLWFAFRRNEEIRLWLHGIWQKIVDFFDWLFASSSRLYYRSNQDGEEVSYRDKYKKLRPTGYDTARRAERGEMSWREFRSRLSACPDESTKLTYAYRILVVRLRAQPHFPLLRSDTPRSIDRKVRARGRHEELREITVVYEAINYAERSPEPERVNRALESACRILQEYLH